MNECMHQLIKVNKQNHCSEKTTSREIKFRDIYYVKHNFGQISGKILLTKQTELLEITCIKHRKMAEIIGKALIIMTNNCNLKLDGKIIFKKENDIEGFVPQIVYNNITVKEQ